MKKALQIVGFLFFTSSIFSQVVERKMEMSLGVQPCLTTDVKDVKVKKVEKLWKKFFKTYGKVKKNKKAKEFYSTGVSVKRIKSGDPIDVYFKIVELGSGVSLNIWYDLGTKFLSEETTPNEYSSGEELLEEFSIYLRKIIVEEELEIEKDNLKHFEKQLKSAKKKNKKLHDKIKSYKEKITKAKGDIEKNIVEQEEIGKQIEDQIMKVKQVEDKLSSIRK